MARICLALAYTPGTRSCHWGSAQGLEQSGAKASQPNPHVYLTPRPPLTVTTPSWTSPLWPSANVPTVARLTGASPACPHCSRCQASLWPRPWHSFSSVRLPLFVLCHFSTSYSLPCHSVHLPSDHLQKLINEDLHKLHCCNICFCVGTWLITPNCFLLPNRFCIHSKCPCLFCHSPLHSQWPDLCLRVLLPGLVWSSLGPWAGGGEELTLTQATLRNAPDPGSQEAGFWDTEEPESR